MMVQAVFPSLRKGRISGRLVTRAKAKFPEDYFEVRVIDNKLLDKVDGGSRKEAA